MIPNLLNQSSEEHKSSSQLNETMTRLLTVQETFLESFNFLKKELIGKVVQDESSPTGFRNKRSGKLASAKEFASQEFTPSPTKISDDSNDVTSFLEYVNKNLATTSQEDTKQTSKPDLDSETHLKDIRKNVVAIKESLIDSEKSSEQERDRSRREGKGKGKEISPWLKLLGLDGKSGKDRSKKKDSGLLSDATSMLSAGFGGAIGGMIGPLLKSLAPLITGTLLPMLGSLIVGPAGIIAAIGLLIMDVFKGLNFAEVLGVSKASGIIGAIFGGDLAGGIVSAFKNAGKWALIGAIAGFPFGGPIGAIIGGTVGAALGGILGFIGGGTIALWAEEAGNAISNWWDSVINSVLDFDDMLRDAEVPFIKASNNFVSSIVSGFLSFVGGLFTSLSEIEISLPKDGVIGAALGKLAEKFDLPTSIKPFAFLKGAGESVTGAAKSTKEHFESANKTLDEDVGKRKEAREERHEEADKKKEERETKLDAAKEQLARIKAGDFSGGEKEETPATPTAETVSSKKEVRKIAGEEWIPGQSLSDKQMQAVAIALAMDRSNVAPDVLKQYNKQKGIPTAEPTSTPVAQPTATPVVQSEATPAAEPSRAKKFIKIGDDNEFWSPGQELSNNQLEEIESLKFSGERIDPEALKQYNKQKGIPTAEPKSVSPAQQRAMDARTKDLQTKGIIPATPTATPEPKDIKSGGFLDTISRGVQQAKETLMGGNQNNVVAPVTTNVVNAKGATNNIIQGMPSPRASESSWQRWQNRNYAPS